MFGTRAGMEFSAVGVRNVPESRAKHSFMSSTISTKSGRLICYGTGDTLYSESNVPIYPSYLFLRPRDIGFDGHNCMLVEDNYISGRYYFIQSNVNDWTLWYSILTVNKILCVFTHGL